MPPAVDRSTSARPALTDRGRQFVADRHLATLSTIGPRGDLHVVAVGFTYVDGVVRVITDGASQKVRNVERDARATVAQVSGPEWLSIAGRAVVERDPESVDLAVRLYAERYRQPRVNPTRVVIRIDPDRALGSAGLWA
ncbi:pyridoxamine 5'-phosphate oxidase family protein [Agromyces sp. MMS24-K17]|uniref:pyridoxamine 5'-phosphate oxidase family protein n=1 Tax=Agromyces sp. MMS24-K17 TaxID=3372850 RepID=UPI003754D2A9